MKNENYIEKNFRKIWIKPALIVGKAKKTDYIGDSGYDELTWGS